MNQSRDNWLVYRGSRPIALVLLALLCVGGLYFEGAALLGSQPLDAHELGTPPIGRYVDVSCDSVERVGSFENGRPAYLCRLGDKFLPIVGVRADDGARGRLSGRLREFGGKDNVRSGEVNFIWSDDVRRDPAVARAYLLSFRWGIGPWARRSNRRAV